MMKDNHYIIISIVISFSISTLFFIINKLKINKLKIKGKITEIKEDILFSGNNEDNYYYNYYFITNDDLKIKITHNGNRKSLSTDKRKYHNKKIIYLESNPSVFIVLNDLDLNNYNYYFIVLPIIFLVIFWFFKGFFIKFYSIW